MEFWQNLEKNTTQIMIFLPLRNKLWLWKIKNLFRLSHSMHKEKKKKVSQSGSYQFSQFRYIPLFKIILRLFFFGNFDAVLFLTIVDLVMLLSKHHLKNLIAKSIKLSFLKCFLITPKKIVSGSKNKTQDFAGVENECEKISNVAPKRQLAKTYLREEKLRIY